MKKKVLLSSLLTIALCLCLIAGSTFALFTSQDEVNIAVTSGEVEMAAEIALTKLESVKGDVAGTIFDENGNAYVYEDVTANNSFTNGGKAAVNGSILTMTEVTPGDKVTFEISGKNTSNVAIQYRYIIDCFEGEELMKGLVFTVAGTPVDKYMESYTAPWTNLAVGSNMAAVEVSVELPVTAGNEFEKKSTNIRILVEAIQENAVVEDNTDPVITYYNTAATAAEAAAAIADPYLPVVNLTEDINEQLSFGDLSNKTINVSNHVAKLKFTGTLDNVVIDGIADNGDEIPAVQFANASGDVTIKNSVLIDNNTQPYGAVAGGNAALSVTLEKCTVSGARPIYNSGATKNLTLIQCTIKDTSSWAVLINAEVIENIVIDGCTFENCVGLFKATRAIGGDFTFINNTITNCQLKNGYYVDAKVNGAITVSGNTMNGNGIVAADLLGIVQN